MSRKPDPSQSQRQMEDLFTEIHKALMKDDFEQANAFLEVMRVGKHPRIHIIGALRAAFPVREQLSAWQPLLEEVAKVTDKRLLRGLL